MASDFAIVKINSKQHLVEKNSRLTVDRVSKDSEIEVLMAGVGDNISFGEPVLGDFGVKFEVVSEGKDAKLVVRRYKSKSRYRKNKGHRQPITTLKVVDFGKGIKNELVFEGEKAEKAPKAEKPAKKSEPKAKKEVKSAKSSQ